ncbi:MAG: S8 family serine peptidase [Ignavibacteria bacterium]
MNRKYFLLVFFFLVNTLPLSAQQVIQNGKTLYLSNTLMVRVKSGTTLTQLNKTLSKFSFTSANEIYPSKDVLNNGAGSDILAGIYLVKYNTTENPEELAAKIEGMPDILWAEPKYIRRVCYTPGDSLFATGQQDYLIQVDAVGAWDITTGDKKAVIGIVDVGVDWRHPDLAANIFMKGDSLLPGSDLGGLHGTPDDDPSEDIHPAGRYHGTFIAGVAGAVTDNEIGIASIGFNCSILPVKVSKDDSRLNGEPLIIYGFEGIKWAVDHGAKIINCSWGGYIYSYYEQSIIDYAIEKGALVVAAYGNDSANTDYYPAAYNGVLSVGWLNSGIGVNSINPGANYGRNVKVFAPGSGIYSTWQRPTQSSPGNYRAASGSSAAAPLVSGLAALVWSSFPFYTSRQVAERIRVTSGYIDDFNNSSYRNLLGHGVINAYRAVDENVKAISVRADKIHFIGSGNQEGIFGPGEEVSVSIDFTNYISKVDNITVTLTTTDNYITIENGIFNTGPMDTLTTLSNETNQFKFKIDRNVPDNHTVYFLLKYSDGADYNDFQWMNIKITSSYYTSSNNNITLTVTSKGTIGFIDYPFNRVGEGFKYRGSENLMFEGALMYGTGPANIMNAARIIDRQKQDFVYSGATKTIFDEGLFYGNTHFSDVGAGTNALGIQINQSSLSFAEVPDSNYIVLISELINETSKDIEQLYAGYFIDWNIPESSYETNTAYFDTVNNMAIAYNTNHSASPYTAMSIIARGKGLGFYAIDNKATSGPVQVGDINGFSDAEKWYALSNGVKEIYAGNSDISYVISGGPYDIPAGLGIYVEFVLGAGSTLQEAINAVKAGRKRLGDSSEVVEQIPAAFHLDQNYPNPFNPATVIAYTLAEDCMVTLIVYDILGRIVTTLVNEFQHIGDYKVQLSNNNQLSSGVYFYRLTAGSFSSTKKMILVK